MTIDFNARTGEITATTFSGAFSGTADVAATVTTVDDSADTAAFIAFVNSGSPGDQAIKTGSNLAFDAVNGTLTTTALSLTTALDETDGGTGTDTYTTGDILYASAANTLSKLAAGTDTYVLTAGGAGVAPAWAAAAGGSGTVTSSGSPLNNEVAVFATATDINSDSTFTWDGTTLTASAIATTATNALSISSAQPRIAMTETGLGADLGPWVWNANGGDISLSTATDASPFTPVTDAMKFTRGATTAVSGVAFTGDITTSNASGPAIQDEAVSGTNPTLIPLKTDLTTGIGSIGAGGVSIITSGVERVATGTVTHTISLNTQIHPGTTGPMLQIGDGTLADQDVLLRLNSDAPYGFIQEGDAGTAVMAFKAFTNDLFTIQDSAGATAFTFTPSSGDLAATSFTASSLTENDVLIAGASGLIEDTGGNWIFDGTTMTLGGTIRLTERAADTNPTGGRGEIWVKSGSLGGELMYTEGDSDNIFTAYNVIETTFHHDQTTTAADPGAGNMRWSSITPASVTAIYLNDTDETGRDASFLLSNLAVGDILTMRSMWSDIDYFVAEVDAATTDNTGWWTIPVNPIHTNSVPTTGDPMHITVEWAGSSAQHSSLYSSGTLRAIAEASGEFTIRRDDSSDSSTCRLNFSHANGVDRGWIGFNASSTLNINNEVHGGGFSVGGETAGGSFQNIFSATPGDNDTIVFSNGVSALVVQDDRIEVDAVALDETSAAPGDISGQGSLWNKDTEWYGEPNWTDSNGTDFPLGFARAQVFTTNGTYDFNSSSQGRLAINGMAFFDNSTAYTITLENSSGTKFPVECSFQILVVGTGTITITEGTSTTLWFVEDGTVTDTAGGCTMGEGVATVFRSAAGTYYIWGSGITA